MNSQTTLGNIFGCVATALFIYFFITLIRGEFGTKKLLKEFILKKIKNHVFPSHSRHPKLHELKWKYNKLILITDNSPTYQESTEDDLKPVPILKIMPLGWRIKPLSWLRAEYPDLANELNTIL